MSKYNKGPLTQSINILEPVHQSADIDIHQSADIDIHQSADVDTHQSADIDTHQSTDIRGLSFMGLDIMARDFSPVC